MECLLNFQQRYRHKGYAAPVESSLISALPFLFSLIESHLPPLFQESVLKQLFDHLQPAHGLLAPGYLQYSVCLGVAYEIVQSEY